MNFTEIIDNAKRFAGKKQADDIYDDLTIDRLHNRYTVAILVCCCIAISTYQHIGDPLECWVPAQFNNNYEEYTNRLCYIQNTYHVPREQTVPRDSNQRRERTLKYYQWIDFVILLQALCFSFPRIIWRSFNHKIGISIEHLVDASNQSESFHNDDDDENTRYKGILYIADCLQRYEKYVNIHKHIKLSVMQRITHHCRLFFRGRTGSSLACLYIFIRFLYILNLILQILFLQYFLSYYDTNYIQYSFHIFKKFLTDFMLPESKLFPRITLCDFQIRELGERHKYTVECILVINIFIEKMYFILWLWFGILLSITIFDTIYLIHKIFNHSSRNAFLATYLNLIPQSSITQTIEYQNYRHYFPIDNILTLLLISSNSNSLIVAEILYELFQRKLIIQSDV